MKRIIKGATYNTETATVIAQNSTEGEGGWSNSEMTLYQNRAGVFFSVDEIVTRYKDRYDDIQARTAYEWQVVGNAAKARKWCEDYDLTILRDIDDMPPEAEAGEQLATIYARVPPALKQALDERAKTDGVSVNHFVMRCVESCLKAA